MKRNLLNQFSLLQDRNLSKPTSVFGKVGSFVKNPIFHYILFGIAILIICLISVNTKVLPRTWFGGIVSTAAYSVAAIGFCLLMGYSGMASLGTGGFIGIGCYSVYYVFAVANLPYILSVVVAIAIAAVIGVIVGFISLRIESIYLVILTLGLSEILRNVFVAIQNSINIGTLKIFGIALTSTQIMYIIIPVLVVIMIITHNLIVSPTGRAMLAMKNSPAAAQAMGISLIKYRLTAFIICTIFAALSGTLIIIRVGAATASDGNSAYALITSLNILAAVIIGGYRSIFGAVFGTFVMYGLSSTIFQQVDFMRENPEIIPILSGVLVIIIVMFFPGGLAQLLGSLKQKIKALFKKIKEAKYGKDLG